MYVTMALIFFCQIIVLSIFVPQQYQRISRLEITRYPQKSYPLLYTLGEDVRIQRQNIFLRFSYLVAIICFSILAYALLRIDSDQGLLRLYGLSLFLQLSPYALVAYWQWQVKKVRQTLPAPSVRSASLKRNQVSDFVSPLVIFTLVAALCLVVSTSGFALFNDYGNQSKVIGILLVNVLFGVFVFKKIIEVRQSPRDDPYAASKDVTAKARKVIHTLIFTGLFIALSSLLTLARLSGWFDQDYAQIVVVQFLSVIYQIGFLYSVLLKKNKIESTDYSVFKKYDEPETLIAK